MGENDWERKMIGLQEYLRAASWTLKRPFSTDSKMDEKERVADAKSAGHHVHRHYCRKCDEEGQPDIRRS